jgi:hypothetical protein
MAIFALDGIGQVHRAGAFAQILGVNQPHPFKMLAQGRYHGIRQNGVAVLEAFAVTDGYLLHPKVNVLDSQTEHLHQPQPTPILKLRHHLRHTAHGLNDAAHLFDS